MALVNYATQNYGRKVVSRLSFPVGEDELILKPGWQGVSPLLLDKVMENPVHLSTIEDMQLDGLIQIENVAGEIPTITHLSESRQKQIIAETFDAELLEAWTESCSHRSVLRAIDKQLDAIAPDPAIEAQKPASMRKDLTPGQRDRLTKHQSKQAMKTRSGDEAAIAKENEALKAKIAKLEAEAQAQPESESKPETESKAQPEKPNKSSK